jgi:hypothetical protein
VFFWSEEEARAHRKEVKHPVEGLYLTMEQAGFVGVRGQASLFDVDLETGKPRR